MRRQSCGAERHFCASVCEADQNPKGSRRRSAPQPLWGKVRRTDWAKPCGAAPRFQWRSTWVLSPFSQSVIPWQVANRRASAIMRYKRSNALAWRIFESSNWNTPDLESKNNSSTRKRNPYCQRVCKDGFSSVQRSQAQRGECLAGRLQPSRSSSKRRLASLRLALCFADWRASGSRAARRLEGECPRTA